MRLESSEGSERLHRGLSGSLWDVQCLMLSIYLHPYPSGHREKIIGAVAEILYKTEAEPPVHQ